MRRAPVIFARLSASLSSNGAIYRVALEGARGSKLRTSLSSRLVCQIFNAQIASPAKKTKKMTTAKYVRSEVMTRWTSPWA